MKVPSFIQSCWSRRWFRALTWLAVSGLTVLVLLYQYCNWAGARAWEKVRTEVVADGESLDFRRIVDEPVPDEQNFGALPVFKNLALGNRLGGAPQADEVRKVLSGLALPEMDEPRPKLGKKLATGQKTDLGEWAAWLRKGRATGMPEDSGDPARDILAWMASHDAVVQEIAKGLDRPRAQWTPAWKTRELTPVFFSLEVPHYGVLQKMSTWLGLRAVAAARAGDARTTHESMLILIRMAQATQREPMLIGALVAMAHTAVLSQVLGEVCEARVGTGEDFQRLARELRQLKPTDSLLLAERAELATATSSVLWLKGNVDKGVLTALVGGPQDEDVTFAFRLVPAGWYDANVAQLASMHLHYVIQPLRDRGLADCVERQPELEARLKHTKGTPLRHPDMIIAQLALPAMTQVVSRTAHCESLVMQMITACELEAYYLQHQRYPEKLEELGAGGQSIPVDPLTGEPLRYQKRDDGRYRLWTFGLDRKDDGGKRVLDGKNPENTKFADLKYQGDWVWE